LTNEWHTTERFTLRKVSLTTNQVDAIGLVSHILSKMLAVI